MGRETIQTRENRNMGKIDDMRKAQVELEDLFQDATAGVKFDKGKLRMDLLPPDVLEALAQILTDGAVKYGAYNWSKGMAWSRPYAALMRHLLAWWGGQDTDPESGHSHLWHVLTNAAFLVAYEQRGIGEDDRP